MLKEHRKLRGSINIVFQDVSDIKSLGVAEIILNQCKTRFIFQNIEADEKIYKEYLDLKDNQIEIIKGIKDLGIKRAIIVQKQENVSIIEGDLSHLGELTKLYTSSSERVKIFEDIKSKYPKNWVEEYLKI